jgi:Flp pilus assembly pilin Flp
MLRRIHDPERGASFTEYAAVILLVAAILATVIGSGLGGRVAQNIASAVEAVGGPGPDGAGEDGAGDDAPADAPQDDSPAPGDEDDSPGDDTSEGTGDEGAGDEGDDPAVRPQTETVDDDSGDSGDDDDGGLLDTILQGAEDMGEGAWNAVEEGFDFSDEWEGLTEGFGDFVDDPVQWGSDTVDSVVDGATGAFEAATDDPVGFVRDVLFSDEVQDEWNDGSRLQAGTQAVVENAIGLIPYFGWSRKLDRVNDVADAGRGDRGDGDEDGTGDDDGEETSELESGGLPSDRDGDGVPDDEDADDTDGPTCRRPSNSVVRFNAVGAAHPTGPGVRSFALAVPLVHHAASTGEEEDPCHPLFRGEGFQHVLNEHVTGSPGVTPQNTLFNDYYDPEDIADLIQETVENSTGTPNTPDPETGLSRDGTVHTYSYDYPIGTTQGDPPQPLYGLQVVLNTDGTIRTAFPVDVPDDD